MNRNLLPLPVVVVSTLATSLAFGQSSEERASRAIEPPPTTDPSLNQVRFNGRLGYNISAHLEHIGRPTSPTLLGQPIPPSVTGITYQDGFVGRDESGNALGLTQYWGYANDGQITDDGRFLLLSNSRSGTFFEDLNNDPQPGLEVGYARQLGEKDGTKYGIEGAFTYLNLNFRASGATDPQLLGVDAFYLGDPNTPPIIPPLAPYRGSFDNPGPLISDTPIHYPVTVVSQFDASLYGLKLGPYLELPLSPRVSLSVSGGFAVHLAESDFSIQQSAAIRVPGISPVNLSDSDLSVLPGAYISGRLTIAISDSISLFGGLEYEGTGKHSQRLADKRLEIDFWNSVYLSFGASYSF